MASRVSFYLKVDPELAIRYSMYKLAGYLKSKDINAQLEARLKELLSIYGAEISLQQRSVLESQIQEAYERRYNIKRNQDSVNRATPTPTDSFSDKLGDVQQDEQLPEPIKAVND